jgi:hypothetical protein
VYPATRGLYFILIPQLCDTRSSKSNQTLRQCRRIHFPPRLQVQVLQRHLPKQHTSICFKVSSTKLNRTLRKSSHMLRNIMYLLRSNCQLYLAPLHQDNIQPLAKSTLLLQVNKSAQHRQPNNQVEVLRSRRQVSLDSPVSLIGT